MEVIHEVQQQFDDLDLKPVAMIDRAVEYRQEAVVVEFERPGSVGVDRIVCRAVDGVFRCRVTAGTGFRFGAVVAQ